MSYLFSNSAIRAFNLSVESFTSVPIIEVKGNSNRASFIMRKSLTYKILLSVLAQFISVVTSFILGFIVPKFIDEYQYAYWQLYVLYAGYVGLLHFGLLDGLVLRYSQYDYNELDKPLVRSQVRILFIFN